MSETKSPPVPVVRCTKNGPYLVEGLTTLIGIDGAALETKAKMALCRCGRSGHKPFCDGTHAKVGFDDARDPNRVPDRQDTYVGRGITIHDNRGLCAHAGHCSDNLKAVFRGGVEPWIDPDGAAAERIADVIRMCPSGALSYEIEGSDTREQERPAAIRVTPHGPYRLEGGVALLDADTLEGASAEHRTLCRCGRSKNKPFCDGSHWHANFRDDGRFRVALLGDLRDAAWVSLEVEGTRVEVTRAGDGASARIAGTRTPLETTIDPRWGEVLIELDELRSASNKADQP